ncbi:hypothetical protein EON62_03710 [archaeon]|nr:MAG: hypothetical protein EON62_03710 [archaeon]
MEEQPGGRYAAPDTWWKRTPLWTPSQELVLVRHALRCSAVLQGDTLTIAATIAASLQLEMGDMFSKEDVHDKLRAMAVEYEVWRAAYRRATPHRSARVFAAAFAPHTPTFLPARYYRFNVVCLLVCVDRASDLLQCRRCAESRAWAACGA